jgi:toxin HigB-1
MIKSFKSSALKRFWNDGIPDPTKATKGLDARDARKIARLLSALHAAQRPEDLAIFDGHWLKGDRAKTYAVTVRANWRITFQWDGGPIQVHLEDYHGR